MGEQTQKRRRAREDLDEVLAAGATA